MILRYLPSRNTEAELLDIDVFRLQDPMPEPNPEQTASIWSLMIYTFLDPIIFMAYRIPHLSLDMLPALPDYDHTKHLVKRSFKVRAMIWISMRTYSHCLFVAFGSIPRW